MTHNPIFVILIQNRDRPREIFAHGPYTPIIAKKELDTLTTALSKMPNRWNVTKLEMEADHIDSTVYITDE